MELQFGSILLDLYVGFICWIYMLDLYVGLMLWNYILDLHFGFTYHDLALIRIRIITLFNNLNCLGDVSQGLLVSLALARGAGTRATALVNQLKMRAATRVAARIDSAGPGQSIKNARRVVVIMWGS